MSSPPADGKRIANAAYHAAVVTGLAMGCAKLAKMVYKGPVPKLDFNGYDLGMMLLDISVAMALRDVLVERNLIPNDILK